MASHFFIMQRKTKGFMMSVLIRIKESLAKKSKIYYFFAGVLSVAGLIFASTIFFNGSIIAAIDGNQGKLFPQGYKIISPKIPDNITIFGEGVPIENFEVYERVDREILVNTYWHSSTILAIKR